MRTQMADCWSQELERVVQTMVYEDEDGLIQDILRPENHAQVIRTMWDYPPASVLPRVECSSLIIPAGPTPDRVGSDFAQRRIAMVESAMGFLKNGRVEWIPETIHDIGYHKPRELARTIREFISES